jgi:hypothetical protein
MSILNIPQKKVDYLNQEAIRVAGLIKQIDEPRTTHQANTGSISQQEPVILKKFVGPIISRTLDSLSSRQTTQIKECEKNICVGYDAISCKEFNNLVEATYKAKVIQDRITKETLFDVAFRWAVDLFKNKNVPYYITFITEYIEDNTSLYKVHFPIPNLNIEGAFKIGDVSFEYFDKDYFDRMTHAILSTSNKYLPNERFPETRKNYQGRVFVAYTIHAEEAKAKELAFEQCSLAVDTLKICARTTLMPREILGFDIDSKLSVIPSKEIITTSPNDISEFNVSIINDQHPYIIDQIEFNQMHERGLDILTSFLIKLDSEKSELQNLIITSIQRYSKALSNRDFHQRIVEIYTILEALLLPDDNSPILESTTKYLPMLIEKDIERRRECAKQIRSMYNVRSKLVHHGKKIPFEIESLKQIQQYVLTLIINMAIKSASHIHKTSVLREIDDAMMQAY